MNTNTRLDMFNYLQGNIQLSDTQKRLLYLRKKTKNKRIKRKLAKRLNIYYTWFDEYAFLDKSLYKNLILTK